MATTITSITSLSSPPPTTSTTVFNWGEYCFNTSVVEKSIFPCIRCCCKSIFTCLGCCDCLANCCEEQCPPKQLYVVYPTTSGTYPVLLFFHGTCIKTSFYSQLFKHIASHGFIVVAPQLYGLMIPPACMELDSAEAVADWLLKYGLEGHLPEGITPDFECGLALAGHSRGGRTAFALADKIAAKADSGGVQSSLLPKSGEDLNLSIVIGVDPVASCMCGASIPDVDPSTNRFKFNVPAAVIGSGLAKCCAPQNGNYAQFFKRCNPPKSEFLAPQYGHMDVLDDDCSCSGSCFSCFSAFLTKHMCANAQGRSRDCMSRTVGGIVVAFFKAYNAKSPDPSDLDAIENNPGLAPAQLVINPSSQAQGQSSIRRRYW